MNAAREVLDGAIKTSSIRYKSIHITHKNGSRFVFPLYKVEKNPQTWWKVVVGTGADSHDQDDLPYPEGSSKPEDIRDIVDEAPAEDAEQDSDGTRNSVEQPKEGAMPENTAEEATAP